MHQDLQKVDFAGITAQSAWVSSDVELIKAIEIKFKENLSRHRAFEDWLAWFELLVDQVMAQNGNKSMTFQTEQAKQFLKNWITFRYIIHTSEIL